MSASVPTHAHAHTTANVATKQHPHMGLHVATHHAPPPVNWVLYPTEPIEKYYKFGQRLGQPGQFGYAVIAYHRETLQKRAVKVISKARFSRSSDISYHFSSLRAEIEVMKRMNHANIIRLFDVFESVTDLYLVMECCEGGELFDRIKERGSYSEKDASVILKQICQGIAYMHENHIAHCDLKPDNFLFLTPDQNSIIKIIDFGMSKFIQKRKYFQVICGTPYYCAPEVIKGRYSENCDMWSFGVVMFVMLFGYPPFYAETDDKIFQAIQRGFDHTTRPGYGAHFPKDIPCSDSAKHLLTNLLVMDPTKRWSAREALEHPWLQGITASTTPVMASVFDALSSFQVQHKLKQAVLNMVSAQLSEDEMNNLKKVFQELDENKDGIITPAELKKGLTKFGANFKNSVEVDTIIKMADLNGNYSTLHINVFYTHYVHFVVPLSCFSY